MINLKKRKDNKKKGLGNVYFQGKAVQKFGSEQKCIGKKFKLQIAKSEFFVGYKKGFGWCNL